MIIAGTGHRPKYCPCKYNENHPWLIELKKNLTKAIEVRSPDAVISGAAIGWDTWIAQAALSLGIPLHLYIPFPEQGKSWPTSSQRVLESLKEKAEKVALISDNYHQQCFFKRDEKMVDDCDLVFSLLNPESYSGGTYYTVQYAKKNNKPVINFWY